MDIKKIVTNKYFIALILVVLGAAIGRYLTPSKVVTKEIVVEKEVVISSKETDEKKDENKNIITIIRRIVKPDGTIEEVIEIKENETKTTTTNVVESSKSTKESESRKETIKDNSKPQWKLAALAGVDISGIKSTSIVYGAQAERRILGPVFVGIWAVSKPMAGVSVGLEF